jgi:hypothetical protein
MTQASQSTYQGRPADAALTAHNGRHSDHMVWIGRVAHPKKKTKCDDGKWIDHLFCVRRSGPGTGETPFEKVTIVCHSFFRFAGNFDYFHSGPRRMNVAPHSSLF